MANMRTFLESRSRNGGKRGELIPKTKCNIQEQALERVEIGRTRTER